jgi:hypothetical protein
MDHAIGLAGAVVYRIAAANEIRPDFDKLDAQSFGGGVNVGRGQNVGADGFGPNRHDNGFPSNRCGILVGLPRTRPRTASC